MMTMYGRHCDAQQQFAPEHGDVFVHVAGFGLQLVVPVPGAARNTLLVGSLRIGSKPVDVDGHITVGTQVSPTGHVPCVPSAVQVVAIVVEQWPCVAW